MRFVQNGILLLAAWMVLLAPSIPYLQYYFFQERIATFLCENQAEPELNCNGQCFLAKQLKAQHELDRANKASELPLPPVSPEESEHFFFEQDYAAGIWLCELQSSHMAYWLLRSYQEPEVPIFLPPPRA